MLNDCTEMRLTSLQVFDNVQGNASATPNKASVFMWRKMDGVNVAKLVNVSVSLIDMIDDFGIDGHLLTEMIGFVLATEGQPRIKPASDYVIKMNSVVYGQLYDWWYSQKEVEKPEELKSWAGVEIEVDSTILREVPCEQS